MPNIVNRKELASIFKVTPITIDNWKRKGMPALVIGGATRYDVDEVLEWAKDQSKKQKKGE